MPNLIKLELSLSQEELEMPIKQLADYFKEPRAKMLAEQLDRDFPTKPQSHDN
jgi:hypothetical protein